MRVFSSGLRREGISVLAEAMLAWSNQPAVRGATEGLKQPVLTEDGLGKHAVRSLCHVDHLGHVGYRLRGYIVCKRRLHAEAAAGGKKCQRSRRADFLLAPGPANARAALQAITGGGRDQADTKGRQCQSLPQVSCCRRSGNAVRRDRVFGNRSIFENGTMAPVSVSRSIAGRCLKWARTKSELLCQFCVS